MVREDEPAHEYLYWNSACVVGARPCGRGRWKAILYLDDGDHVELYDLSADTGETDDVAASHPEVVREMRRIIQTAHTPPERFPLFTTK